MDFFRILQNHRISKFLMAMNSSVQPDSNDMQIVGLRERCVYLHEWCDVWRLENQKSFIQEDEEPEVLARRSRNTARTMTNYTNPRLLTWCQFHRSNFPMLGNLHNLHLCTLLHYRNFNTLLDTYFCTNTWIFFSVWIPKPELFYGCYLELLSCNFMTFSTLLKRRQPVQEYRNHDSTKFTVQG